MRKDIIKKTFTAAILAAALGIFTGCGAQQAPEAVALADGGTLILKVNPEIEIGYDENGKVISLSGVNQDGKGIVEGYQDYIGKECRVVVNDLVEDIREAGYFVEEVDSNYGDSSYDD